MFGYRKRLLPYLLLSIALAVMLSVGMHSPTRAEDEAARIYKMARALQDDNIKNENFTTWINGDIGKDPGPKPEGLNVGEDMPDFKFSDFNHKSTKFTPTTLKPPYLMNFWASWCGPCRDEFPLITKNSVEGKLTGGKLAMPAYFINVNDNQADADLFLLTYPTSLPILVDERNAFSDKVQMAAIPQTVLVDANGKIQAIQSSGMTGVAMAFIDEIAANPGLGAFDRQNPDQIPSAPPVRTAMPTDAPIGAATDSATPTPTP